MTYPTAPRVASAIDPTVLGEIAMPVKEQKAFVKLLSAKHQQNGFRLNLNLDIEKLKPQPPAHFQAPHFQGFVIGPAIPPIDRAMAVF